MYLYNRLRQAPPDLKEKGKTQVQKQKIQINKEGSSHQEEAWNYVHALTGERKAGRNRTQEGGREGNAEMGRGRGMVKKGKKGTERKEQESLSTEAMNKMGN